MNKRFISGMAAVALIFAGSQTLPEGAFIGEEIVAGAVTVDSGTCGDPNVNEGKDVTWTLDDQGTLTISGEGAMKDYLGYDTLWGDKETEIFNIIVEDGVTNIGEWAFSNLFMVESVTLPNSVTSIGKDAFSCCSELKAIDIPNSVKSIGINAFSGCSNLENITIPNAVTNIEHGTFTGCRSLKSIIIPNGVTSIGNSAFGYCTGLESVTIPNSVEKISNSAFLNCPNLQSISIPADITNIGKKAFGYDGDKKLDGFKIYCYKDTAGHQYAIDNGFDYELLDADMVISPKLKLSEGEAAPDCTAVTVTAFNAAGGIAAEVNADADGNIDLGDLPEGEYTLKVQLAGFAPRSISYTAGTQLGEVALCKYGDCNGDGAIDLFDLGLMQRKLCKWDVDYIYPETSDTNGDGSYTTMDLGALQRYLCNWGNTLGVEA